MRLYGVMPEVVAHDLHPEYLSTKFAVELDLPTVRRAAPPRPRRRLHGRARPHATRSSASPSTGSATAPTARCGVARCWLPTSSACDGSATSRRCPCRAASAAIREPWRMAAVWACAAGRTRRRDVRSTRARSGARDCGRRSGRARGSPVTTSVGTPVRCRRRPARWPTAGELRGPGRHRAGGAGPHRRPRRRAPLRRLRRVRRDDGESSCSTRRR